MSAVAIHHMATPVEQIKDRLSVLDVVGGYVKLQKSGKHWKGKSPFASEKTPSFFVSPERGMYYCFSSGKGGDIFTFVQEMEGVDFRGALKILAERAGIELTPERPEDRSERETLYAILEEATQYFETELTKAPKAEEYLLSRGVTDVTRAKWRIGFAPAEWRNLTTHLKTKGFSQDLIVKAGLAKGSERSADLYDVFRDRIMFPIADTSGRPVGFSGRDQSGDPTAPKYVNSPETPLYEKSRILFGYDKAKQGIRTLDFALIVEGQFDLVLSHQAGYANTVAISGTAMTDAHLELIGRLTKRIVLALDADKAGIASAKRSAMLALARDMDVKVARIEGGKDPADLVREDPKLLKAAIGHALHVIPFLVSTVRRETTDNRAFRLRIRDEVVPFVTYMPNRIDAEHWEKEIATATETTVDAIHFEVERVREEVKREAVREAKRSSAGGPSSKIQPAQNASAATQQKVPPLYVRSDDVVSLLYGVLLWQESIPTPHISPSQLGHYLKDILGEERMKALEDWSAEEKNKAAFIAERTFGEERDKDMKLTIERLLLELWQRILHVSLKEVRQDLAQAEKEGDGTLQNTLLSLASDIQRRIAKGNAEEQRFTL